MTAKKKAGRPPTVKGGLSHVLYLRLSAADDRALKVHAAALKLPVAEYARRLLLRALATDPRPRPKSGP